ncbi:MAG TPA: flagellar hook-associated protein FlgL [Solirubrobacteraceae bacterium]|nr:flagellar hook-associated protein FlgL [Solirubrobacteraceae bacterium]
MRITDATLIRTVLGDIAGLEGRLSSTQARLSSGKQLTQPSDDPYATGRALGLRADLAATRQHGANVDEASSWADVTDNALSGISDVVSRARELLVRGATDTVGASARIAIAEEIDQLASGAKDQANAAYDGRYVLAGTAVHTPPYTPGSDVFGGDTTAMLREIGPNTTIRVNQSAGDILGSGTAAADGKLLDVLRTISAHLRSGVPADQAALGSSDLQRLDATADALGVLRAQTGAVANRLSLAKDRLGQSEQTTVTALSNVEDADLAKTLVDFSTQQAAYEAALKAGARLVQPSLLDFLR